MNAMEAMLSRRSIRKYKDTMVPRELLDRILEAGTYAATGRGAQSPIMIAVTNRQMRDKLSRMNAAIMGTDSDPFYGAPVVIVVLADKSKPTVNIHDGSLVMGNLMLAAHELGLGSCWIHRAKEEFESEEGKAILKELGVEDEYEGVGNCVLGYAETPAGEGAPRKDNRVFWAE